MYNVSTLKARVSELAKNAKKSAGTYGAVLLMVLGGSAVQAQGCSDCGDIGIRGGVGVKYTTLGVDVLDADAANDTKPNGMLLEGKLIYQPGVLGVSVTHARALKDLIQADVVKFSGYRETAGLIRVGTSSEYPLNVNLYGGIGQATYDLENFETLEDGAKKELFTRGGIEIGVLFGDQILIGGFLSYEYTRFHSDGMDGNDIGDKKDNAHGISAGVRFGF